MTEPRRPLQRIRKSVKKFRRKIQSTITTNQPLPSPKATPEADTQAIAASIDLTPSDTRAQVEPSPGTTGGDVEPLEVSAPAPAEGPSSGSATIEESPPPGLAAAQTEPPVEAILSIRVSEKAITQSEDHSISTSESQPVPEDATVQPIQSHSLWYSEKTPKWNEAVETWKRENPKQYDEIEKMRIGITESSIDRLYGLFQSNPSKPPSEHVVARTKRWLPVLAAARGIAMTIAAIDPYRIAPIICASVFFGIDLALNTMEPGDKDRILNILFESIHAINECIFFEANFRRNSPVIKRDLIELQESLPVQYLRALRLASDIQLSNKDRGRNVLDRLTNKIAVWESQANELKNYRSDFSMKKDRLEKKLSADEHTVKVLKWIKEDSDPEQSLASIKKTVTSEGRHEKCAEWFLDGPEFGNWYNAAQTLGSQHKSKSKQVLWIRGGYGTGKTTILYHVQSALKDLPKFHLEGKTLRIVPYFCTASSTTSERPNYQTIIRSMISHLSLLPGFTLATPTETKYSEATSTRGLGQHMEIEDWEGLFTELLSEYLGSTQFVFLIDALDECDLKEAERLLEFFQTVINMDSSIRLLCSSHQQVRVRKYFTSDILQEVEVTAAATADEMKIFIKGELEYRESKISDSIFFHPEHADLQTDLEITLLENARGMFSWVQVWLKILLPVRDDVNTIRRRGRAMERLNELRDDIARNHDSYQLLEAGYRRLWDLNNMDGFDTIRIRLFQIVLASFVPLSPTALTEALRINGSSYDKDLSTEQTKRLYANFLYEVPKKKGRKRFRLQFVHNSAKKFIQNMNTNGIVGSEEHDAKQFSDQKNHSYVARLYIDVMKHSAHPFWQQLGVDPSNWREAPSDSHKMDRLRQDISNWKQGYRYGRYGILSLEAIHIYLSRYGMRHCSFAAQKRSMFDELWTEVLDSVVLSPDSAFGFVTIVEGWMSEPDHKKPDRLISILCLLRVHEGRFELLHSHVLTLRNIIHEDDLFNLRLGSSATEGPNRQRALFRHAAYTGGNLIDSGLRGMLFWADKRTALHIACAMWNNAAVEMILQTVHILTDGAVDAELLSKPGDYNIPLCMAIGMSQPDIAETLLKFEKQYQNKAGGNQRADATDEWYTSKQWSLICTRTGKTALGLAIEKLDVDVLYGLLSIARPVDINAPDDAKNTALHIAVKCGRLELVKILVEKYEANIEAKNSERQTPYSLACYFEKVDVLYYLASKGANVNFRVKDSPMSAPAGWSKDSDIRYIFGPRIIPHRIRQRQLTHF